MRRRDRDITDNLEKVVHILDNGRICHFGLVEDGMPYVLPMNYGYRFEGDKLIVYMHGGKEGRKFDVIRKDGNCCVEFECDAEMFEGQVACQYGYTYSSLIGFGKASIVDEPEEKMQALTLLMKNLTGKDFEFNERLVSIVQVIKVECDYYTAKHRPLPEVDLSKKNM